MVHRKRIGLLAILAGTFVSGCLPNADAPKTRAPAQSNSAPTISGSPGSSATVGVLYRFRPVASDADGDALSWSIAGKPADAMFSTATGELTWTPTATGTWSGIRITVTDSNNASVSLPAFSVTVSAAPATGSAFLSWSPPTQYADGSALPAAELDAYRIYHGTNASRLSRVAEVDGTAVSFTVRELAAGTHYFAVSTVSVNGLESALSAVGSKIIR